MCHWCKSMAQKRNVTESRTNEIWCKVQFKLKCFINIYWNYYNYGID